MRMCPFCDRIETEHARWSNEAAVGFPDAYPVSDGHTLVVPRIHASDLFAIDPSARARLWALVDEVQQALTAEVQPDGFNIGVNVGAAGGQTVNHAHVHVIPRYAGDVGDPRGGIRWVLPERAAYWDI